MNQSSYLLRRRDAGLCLGGLALLCFGGGADAMLNSGLSSPEALASAATKLKTLPENIGAWTSTPRTIDEREQRLGEIAGYVRKDFRHSETGRAVTLTILCGASGPMSVHPPTACFEGVGYTLVSGPSVVGVSDDTGKTVSLNKASFRLKDAAVSEVVRVFWGWSTNGEWDAPSNPRVSFRGNPLLYKLYTVDRAWETAEDFAQSEAFLREGLPVIRQCLNS
jgi:hypothetical protein